MKMEAAMGLMRRLSPKQSEKALSALLSLLPRDSSDHLSQVDQPLQVLCDAECGKEFILCEYNRDADSYRSPWSNIYHPPLEDGSQPSPELRKLEIEANDVFAIYCDQCAHAGNLCEMNIDLPVSEGHVFTMGRMIEEMERKLRNSLDQDYFGRQKRWFVLYDLHPNWSK